MKSLLSSSIMSICLVSCAVPSASKAPVVNTAGATCSSISGCVQTPGVSGTVTTTPVIIGSNLPSATLSTSDNPIPSSYTFLDTPEAAQCVDAFTRAGITVPSTAVARSIDSNSFHSSGGVAIMDITTTTVPILNVVHVTSIMSDTMLQFLNKQGFYCVTIDDAKASNITIQMSCSAYMTSLQPIVSNTTTTQVPVQSGGHWPFNWFHSVTSNGSSSTTPISSTNQGSVINQVPCII